jgi:hypothetical protein
MPHAVLLPVTPYTYRHDTLDVSDYMHTAMIRTFIKLFAVWVPLG